ncbi:MAG: BsuPI-related putative proteinase inhibitor, partial [Acidimicrobiia bacterium]
GGEGDDDDDEEEGGARADERDVPLGGGLSFDLSFEPDPLRSGQPATWTLTLGNAGVEAVTLTFASSQEGDVVLRRRSGGEAYRWSGAKFFAEAIRRVRLRPNEEKVYTLEEKALDVDPGAYELTATIEAVPAPEPIRRQVEVLLGEVEPPPSEPQDPSVPTTPPATADQPPG